MGENARAQDEKDAAEQGHFPPAEDFPAKQIEKPHPGIENEKKGQMPGEIESSGVLAHGLLEDGQEDIGERAIVPFHFILEKPLVTADDIIQEGSASPLMNGFIPANAVILKNEESPGQEEQEKHADGHCLAIHGASYCTRGERARQ